VGLCVGFSPLLIGEIGATLWAANLEWLLVRFSPLLIGEIGATITTRPAGFTTSTFQSPPHRGDRCNLHAESLECRLVAWFQSPPHRGDRCNLSLRRCERANRGLVSVPSSSGRSVQRSRRAPAAWPWAPSFSPLLIGEIGATRRQHHPRLRTQLWLQSPPHRGDRCNVRRKSLSTFESSVCFSPLLIGEIGATMRL